MSAMTSAPRRLTLWPTLLTCASSLDRQRVDRRTDRAGDRDCRRDEQEFVNAVRSAVVGQFLQLKDLAHGHAHDGNRDPVPGLVDVLALGDLIRPHLAAPGVGGERGKL